jgi:hypothetical protein
MAKLPTDRPTDPGQSVTVTRSADREAERVALQSSLASAENLDAAGLLAAHAVPFATSLGYDPMSALNLPLVQASTLKLAPGELEVFARSGFVLSRDKVYPGFPYGYKTIYAADLPVFVSADSILHAVHRSYDDILKMLELRILSGDLRAMLTEMRAGLQAGSIAALGATATADADLYLAVALALLDDTSPAPVAGASASEIANILKKARAAEGAEDLEIFAAVRTVDFSQFKPRGHYLGTPALERYFRAMMWLGRMDLPILDVDPTTGKALFRRQMFEAAAALTALLDAPAQAHWKHIDDTVRAFVGEPDAMEPPDMPKLFADLDITTLAEVAAKTDQQIAQAIATGGYGQQRIASQIIVAPPHGDTLPLAATFLLLGQRYVVDSHVFSNVVYDRVNRGTPLRMMPDPLDVGFAALGDDAAAALLQPELQKYHYAPDLERMRRLVDAHGAEFWGANLYNLWLSALRTLSPGPAGASGAITAAPAPVLPAVAKTEAWARRLLNTQLASWAELRHDTILYAKQSYTTGVSCEFPDAYVEPNPAFFARVGDFARKGTTLAASLDFSADATLGADVTTYFAHLADVAGILGAMATAQQAGTPPAPEHLAFINKAVHQIGGVCGGPPTYDGWYPELFFHGAAGRFDPTIADVHTQPTDESGAEVGRVLHVGTGYARLMVMTVEACDGPRAYVGLVSSYHEKITEKYQRLDDTMWSAEIAKAPPADVPWLSTVIGK